MDSSPLPAARLAGPEPGGRLDALDGLRGLAVSAVLAYHYTVRWTAPLDAAPGRPFGHLPAAAVFDGIAPLHYGWIGVQLFFFVSGFVILMTLERCDNGLDFAVRRFARLWPPLLVAVCVTAVLVQAFGPVDWRQGPVAVLASLSFVPPAALRTLLGDPSLDWVDGAYWTLSVEVRFYILAALLFAISRRLFTPLLLLAALGALALQNTPLWPFVREGLVAENLPCFAWGAAGWLMHRGRRSALNTCVFGLAGLVVLARAVEHLPHGAAALGSLVAHGAVMALFMVAVFGPASGGLLASAPLVRIGRASYSLYLLHQSLGVMLIAALTQAGAPIVPAVVAVAVFFVFVAQAAFIWIESPAKTWVHARTRGMVRRASARAVQRRPALPVRAVLSRG